MNNIIDKPREGFGEIQIESISEKEDDKSNLQGH